MSPFGIKGFSNYISFVNDFYLDESNKFYILKDSQYLPIKIIFKTFKNKKILKLNDNLDRNEAKLFTNHELYLERSVLKQTDTDEYYHVDLIGLKVYDVNNSLIGIVDEIISNNNLDYINVKLNNNFLMIPFIKKKVKKIELSSKKLFLH